MRSFDLFLSSYTGVDLNRLLELLRHLSVLINRFPWTLRFTHRTINTDLWIDQQLVGGNVWIVAGIQVNAVYWTHIHTGSIHAVGT